MKFNRGDLVYGVTEDFKTVIRGKITAIRNPKQHNVKRPFIVFDEINNKNYHFNKKDLFKDEEKIK